MDMFSDFNRDDSDLFCDDFLDKSLIQCCFMDLIQVIGYLYISIIIYPRL